MKAYYGAEINREARGKYIVLIDTREVRIFNRLNSKELRERTNPQTICHCPGTYQKLIVYFGVNAVQAAQMGASA